MENTQTTDISPLQIRLAKAALNMSNPALSEATGLHKNTINSAEKEGGSASKSTLRALRQFFEVRGVIFVPSNGGPEGVRFAAPLKDHGPSIQGD